MEKILLYGFDDFDSNYYITIPYPKELHDTGTIELEEYIGEYLSEHYGFDEDCNCTYTIVKTKAEIKKVMKKFQSILEFENRTRS